MADLGAVPYSFRVFRVLFYNGQNAASDYSMRSAEVVIDLCAICQPCPRLVWL